MKDYYKQLNNYLKILKNFPNDLLLRDKFKSKLVWAYQRKYIYENQLEELTEKFIFIIKFS